MTERVKKALDNIDMTYANLIDIGNDVYKEIVGEADYLINSAYDNIENLSNDSIRSLMLQLSIKSYALSEIKEKSAFKAALGKNLREEKYAENFSTSEGTIATRENAAILLTSSEILAEEIHALVASLFKSKLDEIHRVVAVLQTVLTTRLQEAKLTSNEIG